ncbi:hypothetical protein [Gemmatimonas aurantiaca]|uniref:hypothetical protein n=1 Tax=Gemmatimonas aurantiaca TaxID=173480 RepID=UPI00301E1869
MTRTIKLLKTACGGVLPGILGSAALFAALGVAPAFTTGGVARAQSTSAIDARFQPWIGCWRTLDLTDMPKPTSAPTQACVVPSTQVAGSVDVLLYSRDSLLSRNVLPQVGSVTDKTIDDCQGRETAAWTADNARLIMRAELTCARGVKRVETGMMTITPEGEWLQLQHLQVGSNEATTTVRFRYDASGPAPAGISFGTSRSTSSLRLTAGAPVTVDQVLDVATHAPSGLTEAWIVELGMAFDLDGKTLVKLADRGMPPSVIDMMVAVSNPRAFSVRPNEAAAQRGIASSTIAAVPSGTTGINAMRSRCAMWDDFCYGPRGMGAWGFGWQYGYGAWDPWDPWYGFNSWRYASRYGYPYGMGYGMPWGGGIYYGGGPVIVVGPSTGQPQSQGRFVKGQGYTRSGGGSSGSATPRSPVSGESRSGASSSGGGASSAPAPSSSSGSSSGEGSGRTAKPRPPGGL